MKTLILCTSLLIALPLVSAFPAHAEKPKVNFYCSTSIKQLRTVAKTKTREINLVIWSSEAFDKSGYSPERRCKIVSDRLQSFAESGSLRYLTTGKINSQNVICVTKFKSKNCLPNGLVLTLEPGDDPNKVLETLFSSAFKVSGGKALLRTGSRLILDLDQVYKGAENETTEPEPQLAN